jgi:hypothetical protein
MVHYTCAKNEKLLVPYDNNLKNFIFCTLCIDRKTDVENLIKTAESHLKKSRDKKSSNKEENKQRTHTSSESSQNAAIPPLKAVTQQHETLDATLQSHANLNAKLNATSQIQAVSTEISQTNVSSQTYEIPKENSQVNATENAVNKEMRYTLDEFNNLNLSSTPTFSNKNRESLALNFDYSIELVKRQKEVKDASLQLSELAGSGKNLQTAQDRLIKAIDKLNEWNNPQSAQAPHNVVDNAAQHTHLEPAASQQQFLRPVVTQQPHKQSALPLRLDKHDDLRDKHFSLPRNGNLSCGICKQDISKRENALKCLGCALLVHTECGFNFGDVDLPQMQVRDNSDVVFHCRRCINKINFEKSRPNNARNINVRHESIDSIFDLENVQTNENRRFSNNVRFHDQHSSDNNNVSMVENMQRTLEEMSHEKMRKEMKTLPLVTNEGLSWKHFYDAYHDSKHLFKPYINAQRIRDAIKCDAIKEKGGENLFHKDTCDETIEFLNNLYKNTTAHMMEKLKCLLASKISHPQDYESVLKYLIKALNFATLQKSIGYSHSGHHQEWMTRIADKLPFEHKSTWQKLCYEKHKQGFYETFHDLESFLKDTIAYVNMVKCDHLFFSNTVNASEVKNKPQNNRNKNSFHNTQNNKEPWDYKCWVCQKDDHFIRDCKVAKEKNGVEVFAIACKLKICTLCGKEPYVRGKACTGQKTPSECRKCPGKKHWATVCPQRKSSKANIRTNALSDDKKKPQVSNNQKAIEYPQCPSLEYPQKPMIMPPPQKYQHNVESFSDLGEEFIANGNSNLHTQNQKPLDRWYLNAMANAYPLENNHPKKD